MIDTRTVKMLAQYRAWADKVMFDGVATLPPGEADKERKTLFKTIIGTLNHNYVVDLIWQAHLEGRAHGFKARNILLHPELPVLWAAQQKINNWFIDWAAAQSEASLNEEVTFTFVNGTPRVDEARRDVPPSRDPRLVPPWLDGGDVFEADVRPPQQDISVCFFVRRSGNCARLSESRLWTLSNRPAGSRSRSLTG